MAIKKLILYLDNNNKQIFKESNISEQEMKQVEFGKLVQKRKDKGKLYWEWNPEGEPYILLLKKVNVRRAGSTSIFNKVIYFEEKDKELAKKKLLFAFKQIMAGRDQKSLQNLSYLTKENLEFVKNLEEKPKKEKDLFSKVKKNKNKEGAK